jgi:triosephosphate isomerase
MREKYILGNWKMNALQADVDTFLNDLNCIV